MCIYIDTCIFTLQYLSFFYLSLSLPLLSLALKRLRLSETSLYISAHSLSCFLSFFFSSLCNLSAPLHTLSLSLCTSSLPLQSLSAHLSRKARSWTGTGDWNRRNCFCGNRNHKRDRRNRFSGTKTGKEPQSLLSGKTGLTLSKPLSPEEHLNWKPGTARTVPCTNHKQNRTEPDSLCLFSHSLSLSISCLSVLLVCSVSLFVCLSVLWCYYLGRQVWPFQGWIYGPSLL